MKESGIQGLFSRNYVSSTLKKPKAIAPGLAFTTLYVDDAVLSTALEPSRKKVENDFTVVDLPPSPELFPIAVEPPPKLDIDEVSGSGKLRGIIQLKKLLQKEAQNLEEEQFELVYKDRQDIWTELGEFFDYDHDYALFQTASNILSKSTWTLKTLLDDLERADLKIRVEALSCLYVLLVGGTQELKWAEREAEISKFVLQFLRLNGIEHVGALLSANFQESDVSCVKEFELVINILYVVLAVSCKEYNENVSDAVFDSLSRRPSLFEKCTAALTRLSAAYLKEATAEKMLLLHKVTLLVALQMHCLIGSRDDQEQLKTVANRIVGLSPQKRTHKSRFTKAKLEDYQAYAAHMLQRYPQLCFDASIDLLRERHPNLPNPRVYIEPLSPLASLFGASASFSKSHILSFPITDELLPISCREAVEVFANHIYLSPSSVQWHQQQRLYARSTRSENIEGEIRISNDIQNYPASRIAHKYPELKEAVAHWEQIGAWYRAAHKTLPKLVTSLVNLLYRINIEQGDDGSQPTAAILTKACLFILFKLFVASKRWHVCAFESVSQLLVDSNATVLFLKMLGNWFTSASEIASDDLRSKFKESRNFKQNFFTRLCSDNPDTAPDVSVEDEKRASKRLRGNFNMFYCAITVLLLLHKMSKNKQFRIKKMVQYKSSGILKKALKIQNPILHLYALKMLGQQLPYLSKKWKQSNMRILTAYYLHCRPDLNEDWLKNKPEVSAIEALDQEESLRSITSSWLLREGYLES